MPLPLYRPGVSLSAAVVTAAAMCLAICAPALAGDPLTDIKINEVESDGAADFIELMNTSGTPTDVGGLVLKDDNNASTLAIPGGTSIPAGGFLAVDTDVLGGFALGTPDAARVFLPNGTTLIDGYSWIRHAAGTYGRCLNGTGAFITTGAVTKGAANVCPAIVPQPWPGNASVTIVDPPSVLSNDTSGLVYEGTGTPSRGVLWAVDNGNSLLVRYVWNGAQWVRETANGWQSGKTLRFPGGTGLPDSEGITLTDAGSAGGVFVSSESNLSVAMTSRISVLRYDVSGAATTLNATREWNLTPDLPTVGFNAGAESVEWVPDTYLVESGFVDQATGLPYDPADYPGHGTGLFFIGLEANGNVYAYALDQTSSNFTRVATFASGFQTFGALHWHADENQLWVVCDNNCDGRSRVFEVDSQGSFAVIADYSRPTGMANLNNEGFTITPDSECIGGSKPVYWADDGNTGSHALRAGTIRCTRNFDDLIAGDLDVNPRDDLVFDTGPNGIWALFNGTTWTKLHGSASEGLALGDFNGNGRDDLAADFGAGGVRIRYDNNGPWTLVHPGNPEGLVTGDFNGNGKGDLVADFGGGGIRIRLDNNNSPWLIVHPGNPEDLATGDFNNNGKDDLAADFGAAGLRIRYDNNNGPWLIAHPGNPEDLVTGDFNGNGRDDLVADFGASGIRIRYDNSGGPWTTVHLGDPKDLVTGDFDGNGKDELLADFGADGQWGRYNNATWIKLHVADAHGLATPDFDNNGKDEVVLALGAAGLRARYNNASWVTLPALPAP